MRWRAPRARHPGRAPVSERLVVRASGVGAAGSPRHADLPQEVGPDPMVRSHMRIAVTGGAGFFGRATIAAAEQAGHQVWAFDRTMGHDVLGSLDELADAD